MKQHRQQRPPVDVHEAFRSVVYAFGVEKMASAIGMPTGTLYNKANLNESSAHKPTLGDAVIVQVVSGDTQVVQAMSYTLGGVFLKLPDLQGVSDSALIEMLCAIQVEEGKFHDAISKALKDKKFSRDEHIEIKKTALHYITAILESVNRIEGMIDE